jgi:L-glutamine-phosphate cytidylyltransferase
MGMRRVHTLLAFEGSSLVKVVILGAGQGKRLLPLTTDIPKALLDIGGKSLIERQIDAFAACGVKEFLVVIGYAANRMERALATIADAKGVTVRTVFNPFFAVADNLASCWMARSEMDGDFVQINGDTLFRADLAAKMLAAAKTPVTVAINHKDRYDADDMKVMSDGGRLTEIGKTLPPETVDAEAIGMYVFRGEGARAYVDVLEASMRESQGLKQWFPSAVGKLAKDIEVRTLAIDGHEWCEVDFPVDLQQARHLVAHW